eukprot:2659200-Alexandrium_andersonii.AAC.1
MSTHPAWRGLVQSRPKSIILPATCGFNEVRLQSRAEAVFGQRERGHWPQHAKARPGHFTALESGGTSTLSRPCIGRRWR